MYQPETTYDPRLRLDTSPTHGQGLYATAPIKAGEVIMVWGGDVYTLDDLQAGRVPRGISYSFIDDDILLAAPADGLDYFINHSCDSNLWMQDEVTVIARRDIQAGEEITLDYALVEAEPEYRLDGCACGSPLCRQTITGNDWQRPDLQQRYRGHFMPYLNRRIKA